MERGIFSMPLPPREKTPSQCFKEYSDWFSVLEDKGFGELWPGEHLTCLWENYPAGDLFLTALSRHTSTMKLGTGISILPLQHPGEVALRIAFLDQLSRRRIMFGVGPGGVPSDRPFMNVTVEHDKYFGRFVESLQMILHIWKYEAPYKLEGKYWTIALPANGRDITLANPMKPYQQPHPPAALPGNSPKSKSLRVGGKNGWLPIEGAAETDRIPNIDDWAVARETFVVDTDKEARDYARNGSMGKSYERYMLKLLLRGNSTNGYFDILKLDADMPDSDVTVDYLIAHVWIVDSMETVTERLQAIRAMSGKFGKPLMIAHDLGEPGRWNHSAGLLSKTVLQILTRQIQNLFFHSPSILIA